MIYESDIERNLVRSIRQKWPEAWILKVAQRHWPDRMIIIRSRVWFVELKRPGGRPSPGQATVCRILNESGTPALISDSVEEIINWIDTQ